MKIFKTLITISLIVFSTATILTAQVTDDIIFLHHSCGDNWLNDGLRSVLESKIYIDEVNDTYYGDVLAPDSGRPPSLGDIPGDNTNMNHWILWFNDYLQGIERFESNNGSNKIIMFKSCFPTSNVWSDGEEPGNPFADDQTLANYRSVYRHPVGPSGTYNQDGRAYRPLEQVFAAHPDILFIPITAPPRHFGPDDETNNQEASRARTFNNWLKNEWLTGYLATHPDNANVAVFDWFDILAYPSTDAVHPNRLRAEYGGNSGDSHPNTMANEYSAGLFSTFLDQAYETWTGELPQPEPPAQPTNFGAVY
ncbi:MAG: hypothetical protein ABIH23_07915, partial [bacterium]